MTRTIALLTDFGTEDIYVGVMKGIITRICPDASLIDITHAIQPQNVRQGAFALLNAYTYFPPGTIFLVVVDPGVGSSRRLIAVQAGGYYFVAPDNGVLAYTLSELDVQAMVELDNPAYHLDAISQTFHGRDVFSPVAAHLAAGVEITRLGSPLEQLVDYPLPELAIDAAVISGEVLHIDHFGNVITSIGILEWDGAGQLRLSPRLAEGRAITLDTSQVVVMLNDQTVRGVMKTYSGTAPGEILATVGSSGYLELAVNQGSCAARLGTMIGDVVKVSRA